MKRTSLRVLRRNVEVMRFTARQAQSFWARLRGLLGYPSLLHSEAIWISRCNSVHCFFMRYALAVVFIDKTGVVLKVAADIQPWRLSWCWGADSVLEFNAIYFPVGQLVPGDRVELVG